uniref:Uncharacterized protein n=1 Tax=Chryseobacterium sp. B5 TaxID=2050562 RepID=A0A2G7T748_9FLAO
MQEPTHEKTVQSSGQIACWQFFYVACRPCCESEILAIKQVAEYLKITARSIYGLATAKKISAFEVVGT